MWNLRDALDLCMLAERAVDGKGWHTGLTGGTLYKDGYRKDADLIFYTHDGAPGDINELIAVLEKNGFTMKEVFSSVMKAVWNSKPVDIFVMERMDLWDNDVKGALGNRGFSRPSGRTVY